MLFSCFIARALRAVIKLRFNWDILQDSDHPIRKTEIIVQFVTNLCGTLF